MKNINQKYEILKENLLALKKVVVAFSGGVDSTFLAAVSFDALKENATAVTIASPLLPADELVEAKKIAKEIGIKHFVIEKLDEDADWYQDNPPDRCYICKKSNLGVIEEFCKERNIDGQLIEGSNFDDLDDYRPGFRAVKEKNVKSPLMDVELTKDEIRKLAKELDLACWDKPASPCLATRFPFGETITSERMMEVYEAEKYLKSLGLRDLRVRVHGDIARIEVAKNQFNIMINNSDGITKKLKQLGFKFVTVDLDGYKKGSMNISK